MKQVRMAFVLLAAAAGGYGVWHLIITHGPRFTGGEPFDVTGMGWLLVGPMLLMGAGIGAFVGGLIFAAPRGH